MQRFFAPALCVLLLTSWMAFEAGAQSPARSTPVPAPGIPAQALTHANAAKAIAYEAGQDLTGVYDNVCEDVLSKEGPVIPPPQIAPPLAQRRVPPRSQWYTEPVKVFDNLYWIGSTGDSSWAVTTSDGIILIDTAYDYTIKELSDGLKKFGLD